MYFWFHAQFLWILRKVSNKTSQHSAWKHLSMVIINWFPLKMCFQTESLAPVSCWMTIIHWWNNAALRIAGVSTPHWLIWHFHDGFPTHRTFVPLSNYQTVKHLCPPHNTNVFKQLRIHNLLLFRLSLYHSLFNRAVVFRNSLKIWQFERMLCFSVFDALLDGIY